MRQYNYKKYKKIMAQKPSSNFFTQECPYCGGTVGYFSKATSHYLREDVCEYCKNHYDTLQYNKDFAILVEANSVELISKQMNIQYLFFTNQIRSLYHFSGFKHNPKRKIYMDILKRKTVGLIGA